MDEKQPMTEKEAREKANEWNKTMNWEDCPFAESFFAQKMAGLVDVIEVGPGEWELTRISPKYRCRLANLTLCGRFNKGQDCSGCSYTVGYCLKPWLAVIADPSNL